MRSLPRVAQSQRLYTRQSGRVVESSSFSSRAQQAQTARGGDSREEKDTLELSRNVQEETGGRFICMSLDSDVGDQRDINSPMCKLEKMRDQRGSNSPMCNLELLQVSSSELGGSSAE